MFIYFKKTFLKVNLELTQVEKWCWRSKTFLRSAKYVSIFLVDSHLMFWRSHCQKTLKNEKQLLVRICNSILTCYSSSYLRSQLDSCKLIWKSPFSKAANSINWIWKASLKLQDILRPCLLPVTDKTQPPIVNTVCCITFHSHPLI